MLHSNPQMLSDRWQRAIILVDMNSFFASVEQRDHLEWRGRPVAITNGEQGTCIITCSYEARAFGIKTGMRLREAKQRCPHLIQVPSNPYRYAETSRAIMKALGSITPDIEEFSIDEAFLDVTHCQSLWGSPEKIGLMARQKVLEASGLLCSIGVSGDKTTAKYAAKINKPNGFTVIEPWHAKERLKHVPVIELCGIGPGIEKFLAKYGVYYCGDIEKLPVSILIKRFGPLGRRIWLMCQAADPDAVHTEVAPPKSMGHGKMLPPNTTDKRLLLIYLQHMCEKLVARLRRHDMVAQNFFIGWRSYFYGWLGNKCRLAIPGNDGQLLFQLGEQVMQKVWGGEPVSQVQVTALDPHHAGVQLDLFTQPDQRRTKLNEAVDKINKRYGEFSVAPAPLLERSSMHNVIAPSWKSSGHRQTI
jgi:DNA polymerase-4